MNISPEEAQEALAAIRQTSDRTRKAYGYNGYYLIVWGLVYFFGFLANQFIPIRLLGWVWGVLVFIAWIASAFLGINQSKQVRSTIGVRIAFFYLALVGFTILWFIILQPLTLKQGVLFFISIYLFSGVVAGILTRGTSTIICSLAMTVLAVAGYYLLPAYFYLWLAVCCGLAMVGIGLTLRLRWR